MINDVNFQWFKAIKNHKFYALFGFENDMWTIVSIWKKKTNT